MFGKNGKEQRDLVIAYKNTFATEMGKKVLFDLMDRFHILNGHKGDPHSEGQRAVVLYLLRQQHIKLEEFDKLLEGDLE